ncbi:AfsR/SARP family transcriptional regulator [Nocardioides sp. URHA0020]|uniref:AfsR/SARP family transcriptional regulator n=1 Tax=Nocardioides sp. URHA0020 TaxID=1380392 RepID=UPI000687E607|nr:bacterial transcriptional activator domain-containing protein [Nocardioides sp. URHA0020]
MFPSSRLGLLGEFNLSLEGERQDLWLTAQRLLALLAVVHRTKRARRATVAERLWPDAPPGRAGSSLRSVLWRLPRPRGRALVIGNATEVWLSTDLKVDLWEAEEHAQLLRTTDPQALPDHRADLALFRDDLLPEWEESWLVAEREAYRQKRLHALERTAGLLCERGLYTDALDAGLGAVQSEPLRETAHRSVIAVHLAEGNHAEALRQYDGYRRLLADELGLRPSAGIRTLIAPLLGRPVDLRSPD